MSAARCPVCRKPAAEDYLPFCSRRCADVDLGRWLTGSYVVPGEAAAPSDLTDERDDDGAGGTG